MAAEVLIKVLLVEDDPVWREKLTAYLDRQIGITVVGVAKTKEDAIDFFKSSTADVVLMDIMLTPPDQYDGIEAASELRGLGIEKVIMLTSLDIKEVILKAFDKGAINYICKTSYEDIPEAIRDAHTDKVKVHSDVSTLLIHELRKERKLRPLTPTERELYDLHEKGVSRSQIAQMLHKSVSTIKNQFKIIRSKLGGD